MIKPTDVRLSNWVEKRLSALGSEESYWRLSQITPHDFISNRGKRGVEERFAANIRPIPLTPKVLEAAGFEIQHGDDDWHGKIDLGLLTLYVFSDGSYNIEGIIGSCHQLHHLSNLYFALKGEELEIDETKLKAAIAETA